MSADGEFTRRKFLAIAAAATGSLLAAAASKSGAAEPKPVDVAIVGAGLAGLTAARDLAISGLDSFVVLEARDRVGGRTLNHSIGGGRAVEMGGQWVRSTSSACPLRFSASDRLSRSSLDLCRPPPPPMSMISATRCPPACMIFAFAPPPR